MEKVMKRGTIGTHDISREITCPNCQGRGGFDTWDCMDVTENPELRERVIHDPMLFFYYCPKCFSQIRIETPCLYIDRVRHMLVWLVPDPEMEMVQSELVSYFGNDSYSDYRCRVARSWGEWREKIIEMESAYDDRLFELVKYGAFRLLKKEEQESFYLPAYHVEFSGDDEKTNELALIFMRDDEEKSTYSYPIPEKIMELTQDIFQPMLDKVPNTPDTGEFRRYDYSWAELIMTNMLEAVTKNGGKTIKELIALWFNMLGKEIYQAEIRLTK